MVFRKHILGLSIAAALPCHYVQAGHEIKTDTLEEVEVSASAVHEPNSSAMHTMDDKSIDALISSTSDTASLLDGIPGVDLYGAGGVSSLPVMHGLADDRLRIQVDGMDLISACGNHMNPPLSYIGASNVDSVKVFAGIVPVSVGGDSIGGAIQVDSPAPEFASGGDILFKGEAGTSYRTNGDARSNRLAMTVASDRVNVTYQVSVDKSNNYWAAEDFKAAGLAAAGREWLDGDEVGSSRYKSTNQSLKVGVREDNHLVELKLGMQHIPYQGWPNQRMDMTNNDSEQAILNYEGRYGWGTMEASLYQEETEHAMQFADDKLFWYGPNSGVPTVDGEPCTPAPGMNGCAAGMPMDTEGKNTGAAVKANIVLGSRDLLRVGIESQEYRMDDWWEPSGKGMWPNTFWNINNGQRDRLALFGEWEAKWSEAWLTQMGLRHEEVSMDADDIQGYSPTYDAVSEAAFNAADHDKTDHNLDVTLLARTTPSDTQVYEFGVSQKTRSPNLYERYSWSTHGMSMRMINMAGDGNGYVGNLDLDPEVAYKASFTADWHDSAQEKWGVKLTPYYTHVEDYIDVERCSGGVGMSACNAANLTATNSFVYLRFVNQRARIFGVDLSGHMALLETGNYGSLAATGVIAYLDGKNKETGDNLYNIMPLNARLGLVHRLAGWTGTAEVDMVDKKDEVSQVRNEMETAGYGLFNLRGSYEWKQLRVDLGVENVFDKFYNDPLGGAYTGQGKTMSGTGVAWGTPVPGIGRSYYAGVNVKF